MDRDIERAIRRYVESGAHYRSGLSRYLKNAMREDSFCRRVGGNVDKNCTDCRYYKTFLEPPSGEVCLFSCLADEETTSDAEAYRLAMEYRVIWEAEQ